jgi:sporulation protein YlmC with PRC-barrel domain
MQNTIRLVACSVAVSFAFAATSRADHEKLGEKSKQASANEIIGMKVINAQNEDLGKVQDLIVDVDSAHVPFAIISSGFAGQHKVAVPLEALQCTGDGKHFTLAATKEELKSASKSPQGQWMIAANAEWTKSVDGYYGNPSGRKGAGNGPRVYLPDPTPKGAERLVQPADRALCEKICGAIDNVQVDVDNGVAHLYGMVDNEEARQGIENKVRAVPGVVRVESHLKVR